MKLNSATFLKFAMVFSYKTFKWTKNVLKNAKIDRRITLQIIVANCTCSNTPVDPISKYFGNGSAHSNIFWKKCWFHYFTFASWFYGQKAHIISIWHLQYANFLICPPHLVPKIWQWVLTFRDLRMGNWSQKKRFHFLIELSLFQLKINMNSVNIGMYWM